MGGCVGAGGVCRRRRQQAGNQQHSALAPVPNQKTCVLLHTATGCVGTSITNLCCTCMPEMSQRPCQQHTSNNCCKSTTQSQLNQKYCSQAIHLSKSLQQGTLESCQALSPQDRRAHFKNSCRVLLDRISSGNPTCMRCNPSGNRCCTAAIICL